MMNIKTKSCITKIIYHLHIIEEILTWKVNYTEMQEKLLVVS